MLSSRRTIFPRTRNPPPRRRALPHPVLQMTQIWSSLPIHGTDLPRPVRDPSKSLRTNARHISGPSLTRSASRQPIRKCRLPMRSRVRTTLMLLKLYLKLSFCSTIVRPFHFHRDTLTSHEKKRHYLASMEQFVLNLHEHCRLVDAEPLPLKRFTGYTGLDTRSIRVSFFVRYLHSGSVLTTIWYADAARAQPERVPRFAHSSARRRAKGTRHAQVFCTSSLMIWRVVPRIRAFSFRRRGERRRNCR